MVAPQDILGSDQWEWLDHELSTNSADINIIGTGLQILANDKLVGEGWFQYPGSQAKLLSLFARTKTSGVVLLSGDIHYSEMNSISCPDLPYRFFEFTSSGLTHAWSGPIRSRLVNAAVTGNRRVLPPVFDLNVGELKVDVLHHNNSSSDRQSNHASPLDVLQVSLTVYNSSFQAQLVYDLNLSQLQVFPQFEPSLDVVECSKASLAHGMPPSCQRVMSTCTPILSDYDYVKTLVIYLIYFITAICIFFVIPFKLVLPWRSSSYLAKCRRLGLYLIFLALLIQSLRTN